MSDNQEPMSDHDLVEALKGEDVNLREKAIEQIWGDKTLCVLEVGPQGNILMMRTPNAALHRLFVGLMYATQHVGDGLGLNLTWVKDPKKTQDKIIVANQFK